MIHIAVCDDEKEMSDHISNMVSAFFNRKNVDIMVLQFSSGRELLQYDQKIDILFLDIRMEEMDGMEIAKELRSRKFRGFLIFITILKEMVFGAFAVQAYDYLVKPVDKSRFEKMMDRLFHSMSCAGETCLLIQKGYESRLIPFEEIVFCEVVNRKVYLYLASEEQIDFYERIEKLEKRLDSRFFRCHRSFLINLHYLRRFKNNTAYMENGKEVPVSRLRSRDFSGIILQYMREWRL